jgi:inosine-uridine nucleoside N-ribohydrolase
MQIRKKTTNFKIPDCKYVIIDTDAGGDDAQAVLFAIHEAKKQGKFIIGITCCDGNAHVADVVKNILIAVSLCDA